MHGSTARSRLAKVKLTVLNGRRRQGRNQNLLVDRWTGRSGIHLHFWLVSVLWQSDLRTVTAAMNTCRCWRDIAANAIHRYWRAMYMTTVHGWRQAWGVQPPRIKTKSPSFSSWRQRLGMARTIRQKYDQGDEKLFLPRRLEHTEHTLAMVLLGDKLILDTQSQGVMVHDLAKERSWSCASFAHSADTSRSPLTGHGDVVFSGCDTRLQVFQVSTGLHLQKILLPLDSPVFLLACGQETASVVGVLGDPLRGGSIRIWDVETARILRGYQMLVAHDVLNALTCDQWLVAAGGWEKINLYDRRQGSEQPSVKYRASKGDAANIWLDGHRMVVGFHNMAMQVQDLRKIMNPLLLGSRQKLFYPVAIACHGPRVLTSHLNPMTKTYPFQLYEIGDIPTFRPLWPEENGFDSFYPAPVVMDDTRLIIASTNNPSTNQPVCVYEIKP